jgi:uncharacterized protein
MSPIEPVTARTISTEEAEEIQRAFILKVYGWMTAGLCITGILAMFTAQSQEMREFIFGTPYVYVALIIAQLGLVIWLGTRIQKMTAMTATLVFTGYAALTGVTLAAVILAYTASSIASTFFVTAGTFGVMSLYGVVTRRDLTGWGNFLMMGLVGMIIASLVNLFLHNETVYWMTTTIGVLVFVGLTAYDTQKIRMMAFEVAGDGEMEQKGAIMGALRLYLDFINLFLLLLRLLGRRR